MTLVVNESQRAENQQSFSAELIANSACLDLEKLGPVGEWDYGQGLRRAKENHYFYELRAKDYSPFGVNHPTWLKAKWFEPSALPSLQAFPNYLSVKYPILKNWRWSIRKAASSTPSDWFEEDSTLKSNLGWLGFEKLSQIKGWVVNLKGGHQWIASGEKLTLDGPTSAAYSHHELLRIFLSEDVLGENGRLKNWQSTLSKYDWGQWSGLNFSFATQATQEELDKIGIAVDVANGKVQAHFGLSMLTEDVEIIMRALRPYQG